MTARPLPSTFGHRNPELRRTRARADALPWGGAAHDPIDQANPLVLPPLRGARLPRSAANPPRGQDNAAASLLAHGSGAAALPRPHTAPLLDAAALILAKRGEQVAKGYSTAADLRLPVGMLLRESMRYGTDALDWLDRPNHDPDRTHYQGKLVNMGALVAAELDRLLQEQGR